MELEELNKQRDEHIRGMKEAGKKLKAMIIPINGKYDIGTVFRCENILDDNMVQIIDCRAISTSKMDAHCHPISREYFLVVQGSIEVKTKKKNYILSKGEHIILKCNEEHSTRPLTLNTRIIAILIPPEEAYRR